MTPQQLAETPMGTKVTYPERVGEKGEPIYVSGELIQAGNYCAIMWEDGVESLIDTKSDKWVGTIGEIEIVEAM